MYILITTVDLPVNYGPVQTGFPTCERRLRPTNTQAVATGLRPGKRLPWLVQTFLQIVRVTRLTQAQSELPRPSPRPIPPSHLILRQASGVGARNEDAIQGIGPSQQPREG